MTKPFWGPRQSTTLSIVMAVVALVGAVAVGVVLVPALKMPVHGLRLDPDLAVAAAFPLYACLASGILAVIVLLGLLMDIRRGDVFTTANVSRLRLISYCGFIITVACVVGTIIAAHWSAPILLGVFPLLGAIAGFLGLLMRVIKNVIEAARLLKEEADFTI